MLVGRCIALPLGIWLAMPSGSDAVDVRPVGGVAVGAASGRGLVVGTTFAF